MIKKYCIVGAGSRGYYMFAKSLHNQFQDCARLLAVCDINQTRARFYKTIDENIRIYSDFDLMIDTEKPDCVIITTMDRFHAHYIIRALEKGCDVITEKPMVVTEKSCIEVFEAEKRTGKKVIVTFNYRFMPYVARIKELLMSGIIGKIYAINFEYLLGKPHGADYLRRWHARMENCGGMLVHKSTHHFDLINWMLEDEPLSVTAQGFLDYYGTARGEEAGGNCRKCPRKKSCEFYLNIEKDPLLNELYVKAEHEDGYIRDNCVFADDKNIYDNMSASIRYSKGTLLTYSLNLFNPYEGFKLMITGDKGRIEAYEYMSGLHTMESAENLRRIDVVTGPDMRITYSFKDSGGTHGGGDSRMMEMIFRGGIEDKLNQFPTAYDGAKSILIGICANESIKSGKKVEIKPILDKIKNIINS